MANLKKLKETILEDGVIDEQEVLKLKKELYEDGIIGHEEADFLFELNDAVSDKANHPSWDEFFVKAISGFLLKDATSPGEIDEDECQWLIDRIQGDGQVNATEKLLLKTLKSKVRKFPKALDNLLK